MVEDLENVACTRPHQRMVKRGADVDEHQGDGEYGAADDFPGISSRGCSDEVYSSHNCYDGSDAVRDGVG